MTIVMDLKLQSNPPLSGKTLLHQQYLESKQTDTTMNVPCDNVVTDVIPPGGGGSQYKSDGPTVLPSNSPLCEKTLLYQQYLEKEKGKKYRTGKLASSITSQCLYHDVFTMYLHHFLPNKLYFLKYTIQQIITKLTSPSNRCTMTPVVEVNLVIDSWTTTPKAIMQVLPWASKTMFVMTHFPPSLLTKYTVVVHIIKLPLLQIQSY